MLIIYDKSQYNAFITDLSNRATNINGGVSKEQNPFIEVLDVGRYNKTVTIEFDKAYLIAEQLLYANINATIQIKTFVDYIIIDERKIESILPESETFVYFCSVAYPDIPGVSMQSKRAFVTITRLAGRSTSKQMRFQQTPTWSYWQPTILSQKVFLSGDRVTPESFHSDMLKDKDSFLEIFNKYLRHY